MFNVLCINIKEKSWTQWFGLGGITAMRRRRKDLSGLQVWQPMFLGYSTVYILAWYLWVKLWFFFPLYSKWYFYSLLFYTVLAYVVCDKYIYANINDSHWLLIQHSKMYRKLFICATHNAFHCWQKKRKEKRTFIWLHTLLWSHFNVVLRSLIINFCCLTMSSLPNGQLV